MKQPELVNSLRSALVSYKDIFDDVQKAKLYSSIQQISSSVENERYLDIYAPKKIPREELDGLRLKDGKGFISFNVKYRYTNSSNLEEVSYVYRYITDEIAYDCTHKTGDRRLSLYYSFHYDKDLLFHENSSMNREDAERHPLTHLQVFHSHPRFPVAPISIYEFLAEVKKMCFLNESLTPYTEPLYSMG